jgi:FG-GAP repeat protein
VELRAGTTDRPQFIQSYIVPVDTGITLPVGSEVRIEVLAEGVDGTFAAKVVPDEAFSLARGQLREVDIVLLPLNETKDTFVPGSRLRGEMTNIGETHDYLFGVRPGESFSVAAFAAEGLFSPVGRSGQLGGLLSVLDEQGNVLGSEPFDAFQDARIDLNVTAAGTWGVRIEAEGKVPGFYVATTGLRPLQVRREYIKSSVLTGGFGERIAMDGRTLVVNNTNSFAVGVFERDSELGWLQVDELLGEGEINSFGLALDIDADTVVVGDPSDSSRKLDGSSIKCNLQSTSFAIFEGAAYVFRRGNDGTWNHEACLKEPGALGDGNFGRRVAISGNTLAVGHTDESLLENNTNLDDAGAVHIYVRDVNDEWSFQSTLRSPFPRRQGKLGGAGLDLDGDTLVVSEQAGFSGSGQQLPPALHVFERSNGSWARTETFARSEGINVGVESVAIDGDVFVAGVPRENTAQASFAGAVFVYEREGDGWSGPTILEAPLPGAGDRFGAAVDLDGEDLIVGAPQEASGSAEDTSDNSLRDAGAAYRARREPDGTWIFTDYIKAIDIDRDDFFGESVAIGADSIAIGTSKDDGVEGDPTDDSATNTGAVYTVPR